jgi:hypothetical protein
MVATTALESTPPDRKAPRGTSAIMRRRTDSRRRSVSSAWRRPGTGVVEGETHVPVGLGRRDRLAAADAQGEAGLELAGARKMVRGSAT